MDEYLIKGTTLRKIAGEARRLANSPTEMTPDEIYLALCSVTPGGEGGQIPVSDGVKFSSTQISPDVNYRVNYNFMAQVVYHVQRMLGTREDMTKEDIIQGLSEILFIPQARIKNYVDLFMYEGIANAWVPTWEVAQAFVVTPQQMMGSVAEHLQVTTVLHKDHLTQWQCNHRHVMSGSNGIQSCTEWTYEGVEESIDVGRLKIARAITNDLISVSSLEVITLG